MFGVLLLMYNSSCLITLNFKLNNFKLKFRRSGRSSDRCCEVLVQLRRVKGAVAHRDYFFPKSLSLFHCVPLYVCRLCINFQDLCARLLGMAALRILLLTFIHYHSKFQ